MTTFSQLVDDVMAETMRPDMLVSIASYVNETIRELHMDKATGSSIRFKANLLEVELTTTVDDGHQWEIPVPQVFQGVEAVFYPGLGKYARERSPSTLYVLSEGVDGKYQWYRSGANLVLMGYGGSGQLADIAWYQFPRKLVYYDTSERPMTWDDESQTVTYLTSYDVDDTTRATAQDKTTNWLLSRWESLVMQGARAKIYARLNATDRAKLAYSLFENGKPLLMSSETFSYAPIYLK
jgi:hypothetical protein